MSDAWHDYLEGYFDSFDFYPVCRKRPYVQHDAYALWRDFLAVYKDVSSSTLDLVNSPERFVNVHEMTDDEIRRRQREATRKAIRKLVGS